jgi:hypothetical protein
LNKNIFGDDSDEEDATQAKNEDDEDFKGNCFSYSHQTRRKIKEKVNFVQILTRSRKDKDSKKKRKKTSKKDKEKKQKEPKSKKKSEEVEGEEVGEENEDQDPEQDEEGEALTASSSGSVGKRAKTAKKEVLEKAEQKALELVAKMEDATAKDSELIRRASGPALHKVGMLPEVVEYLNKPLMHEPLIEKDVLSTVAKWLALLPDGSLPNTKIRESLLDILSHFPLLKRDELTHSGIGKAVMAIWKHQKETPQNKKLAKSLIDRFF